MEEEMAGTTGRIKNPEITGVFAPPRSNGFVDWAYEILATLDELGRLAVHLKPGSAEGVIYEELDDIPGHEELVPNRDLAAVTWSLALLPHLLALIDSVEVLVNPANRLVSPPHRGEVGDVEQVQQFLQHRSMWPEGRGRVASVEKHFHFCRQFIKQALKIEAGAASLPQGEEPPRPAHALRRDPRVLSLSVSFLHQSALLRPLHRGETPY